MKRTIERIFGTGARDRSPRLFEVLGRTLAKLTGAVILAALFVAAAGSVKPAFAGNSAAAYIVVRCTVTLSVSLVLPNTSFALGDVSAGQTIYSQSGVDIRNDSQGAVSVWSLNIDTNTLNNWELSDTPGLNQVAIFGVFQKTQNNSNFDVVKDSFSAYPKDYNGDSGVYACGSYVAEGLSGVESKIIPYQCSQTRSDRRLWIKMLTPLAVTDQATRNIQIVITGRMAG